MSTRDQRGRIDSSGDFSAGHYALTHTVWSNRVNLFCLEPGRVTKIAQFEEDARNIVRALASLHPPSAG